jgi:hypothetical protein
MRTLALCGASCKRRSFFYCTGAAWKSLQLLPLLMVEGYVGRSWAVWTGAMGFADELRMYGVLGSWCALACGTEVVFDPLADPVPHRPEDR